MTEQGRSALPSGADRIQTLHKNILKHTHTHTHLETLSVRMLTGGQCRSEVML